MIVALPAMLLDDGPKRPPNIPPDAPLPILSAAPDETGQRYCAEKCAAMAPALSQSEGRALDRIKPPSRLFCWQTAFNLNFRAIPPIISSYLCKFSRFPGPESLVGSPWLFLPP